MSATVIGLFDTYADAEAAVRDLVDRGISRDRISLVANRYATGYTGNETFETTTADEAGHSGTGHGAKTGSVVGGLTGFLIGMGFLAIPGVGPLLAAGPILSTLAGAGLGAAAGGLLGALTNAGVPKEHAELYSEGVRRGGTLVTVDAPDGRENEIAPILDRHNAVDIEQRGLVYRQTGYTGYAESLPEYTPTQIDEERNRYAVASSAAPVAAATVASQTVNTGESTVIPIVEETLVVGKREVERGGARIHTYVTETPVQEQVTLRDEHVTVERHAVNRAVSPADLEAALTDRTLEVTETGEEAVVAKQARVVEEVTVGKQASEHMETVRDTVRRTDVDVVELDADTTTTTTGTTATGTTTPPRSNY